MRNTIATYKESLSRIANDVLDAADDLEVFAGSRSPQSSPFAERRSSHRFAGSPVPNGTPERRSLDLDLIEQHKAEIERLQASEAEIKALAVNYAAILKEKEGQLSRLHEENSSLRKSLDAINGTTSQGRDEDFKSNKSSSSKVTTGPSNHSPRRQKDPTHVTSRSSGNGAQKNNVSRPDSFSNGGIRGTIGIPMTQSQKEPEALLEEKNKALSEIQDRHNFEIKKLLMELDNERRISADLKNKFSEEQRRNDSSLKDLHDLKLENAKASIELKALQDMLEDKMTEISHLQVEASQRKLGKEYDFTFQSLQSSIAMLQEENNNLKLEKERLAAALEPDMKDNSEKHDTDHSELFSSIESNFSKEREGMLTSIQQLEKKLKETCKERDKAQKELARLKQHLLDKELEESEKMDEDSKTIEELRAISENLKAHILKLEKALRQEIAKHEEVKNAKSNELQKSAKVIDDLNRKLENYINMVDTKNIELQNLQTALGQYYAECEAKERLEMDLAAAKEELAKLNVLLKGVKHDNELLTKEKEDISYKLSQTERMASEHKRTIQKFQEDNSKLHRAVEQSMTRINRMSMDSDFYVDRRIVIKLLVTYFQRNHSKEVLDLMMRMLGFSDEDKQRIGFAQQTAGKASVRGVLGLPGRLVGGILGGKGPVSSEVSSENQSFADLWVDFLLKETEERGKRESEAASQPSIMQQDASAATTVTRGVTTPDRSSYPMQNLSANRFASPFPREKQLLEPDSEFASVPLISSASSSTETSSRLSRLLQK